MCSKLASGSPNMLRIAHSTLSTLFLCISTAPQSPNNEVARSSFKAWRTDEFYCAHSRRQNFSLHPRLFCLHYVRFVFRLHAYFSEACHMMPGNSYSLYLGKEIA